MPFLETKVPGLEGVEWMEDAPELESGTFLLNFWDSGCMQCLDTLEQLEDIHRSHPELEVVGLHVPELLGREAVEQIVSRAGFTHHVGHDEEGEASESFGVSSFLLVHDGKVAWQKTPGNSFEQLAGKVEELTGQSIPALEPGYDCSDDIYLGYSSGSAVNEGLNFRGEREFELPDKRIFERVYLDGEWEREEDCMVARGGRLVLHQRSSGLGLVASGKMKDIEVKMDGEPVPGKFAGDDLRVENGMSYIRLNGKRLYSVFSGQRRRFELGLEPEKGARLHKLSFR